MTVQGLSKIGLCLAWTFLNAGVVYSAQTGQELKKELSPLVLDRKTAVLDVSETTNGQVLVATTEEAIEAYLKRHSKHVKLRRLPDTQSLEGFEAGVISVPVAAIHREARFSSEIISEALMGTPVFLLEKKGWWRVQTPEGYHGWIHRLQLQAMRSADFKRHFERPQAMVTAFDTGVYSLNDNRLMTSLTAGALLSVLKREAKRTTVVLPNGKSGWIATQSIKDVKQVFENSNQKELREKIAQSALQLLGRTYRWAGASAYGMDCSGFVKVAWLMNGLVGPRDTDEMAAMPGRLPVSKDYAYALGDLLFFGSENSVGHVAISLGGTRFVHSLGDVHIGDFDPNSAQYDNWAKQTFLFAVRPEVGSQCIRPMTDLPLFEGRIQKPFLCPLDIRR